jgi:hypothetical protein
MAVVSVPPPPPHTLGVVKLSQWEVPVSFLGFCQNSLQCIQIRLLSLKFIVQDPNQFGQDSTLFAVCVDD